MDKPNPQMLIWISLIMLPLSFSLPGCAGEKEGAPRTEISAETREDWINSDYVFPYDLSSPDKKWKMPKDLVEISGLSYCPDGLIAAVEDEHGIIYLFDEAKEEVVGRHKFGGKGDYEGVEVRGKNAFVLRSDGLLFAVSDYRRDKPDVTIHRTGLSSLDNAEGLCLNETQNHLLIASKEPPMDGLKKLKQFRQIIGFDLDSMIVDEEPFLLADMNKLQAFIQRSRYSDCQRLAEDFDPSKKSSLMPSGIAIHPVSGNLYVISTVGKILVVMSPELDFLYAGRLDREVFKQPEGICFSPEGDLYISNEGRDGKGNILKFKRGAD